MKFTGWRVLKVAPVLLLLSAFTDAVGCEDMLPKDAASTRDGDSRSEREFRIPTRLLVTRSPQGITVKPDPASVRILRVAVRQGLESGFKSNFFYYNGTQRVQLTQKSPFGGGVPFCELMLAQRPEDFVGRWGFVQVVVEMTLFETEVPIEHAWMPRGALYRELWSGVAIGEVAADN